MPTPRLVEIAYWLVQRESSPVSSRRKSPGRDRAMCRLDGSLQTAGEDEDSGLPAWVVNSGVAPRTGHHRSDSASCMAAELVGTAYVRIRAITAGLASEIKDGVEKGAKDADLDKAGGKLGEDLGAGASESFKGSMADGVTEAFDSPEMHKASEEGGEGVAKDVAKGVDKENKRKNPFSSMLDALKNLNFKGALNDVDFPSFDTPDMHKEAREGGERVSDSFGDGVDEGSRKRNPFKRLLEGIKYWMPKITLQVRQGR